MYVRVCESAFVSKRVWVMCGVVCSSVEQQYGCMYVCVHECESCYNLTVFIKLLCFIEHKNVGEKV